MLNFLAHSVRFACLIAAFVLFPSFTNPVEKSQPESAVFAVANNELLIQFPRIDDKTYPQIRSVIASIPGVTVDGYCATNQIFVLNIDRTIQPGDEAIFAALKTGDCGEYYVKTGATAANVYAACSDIR